MAAAVVMMGVFALTGAVGTASAATVGSSSSYLAQARSAGLTTAQAQALQQKVDGLLAQQSGSHQVSANRIDFPGGIITVGVPGQRRPRDLAAPAVSPAAPRADAFPCAFEDLCVFQYNDANKLGDPGEEIDYYHCGTYSLPDWTSTDGTYVNNQTVGTVAKFEGATHNVLSTSTAYEAGGIVNWNPVYYVVPCGT